MKFEIYPDAAGKTRWRLMAANGKNIANGSEGYNGVGNAKRAIKTFRKDLDAATVVVVPKPIGEAE